MLQFILGRCGSGKSEYLRNIIKNKIEQNFKKIILVVPEQSSFENEKSMLKILGNDKFKYINVLSFSRMGDFVSQKLNLPVQNIAGTITQNIKMNYVLEKIKNDLSLYKKSSLGTDTAALMLRTMQDFKSYKVSPDTLKKIYEKSKSNTIKQKIIEINKISKTYEDLKYEDLIDPADSLNIIQNDITANKIFEGYTVFFDEFNSFTQQQISIIEAILKQSKDVYMSFCAENLKSSNNKLDLFYPVQKTIDSIKSIAIKNKIDISEPIILNNNSKFKNDELKILEKNIFKIPKEQFDNPPKNIIIYRAQNIYDECENIARKIKKLTSEKKYRFKDFAVLTRNLELYASPLKRVFKRYGIPVFLDSPESVLNKSLTNMIFSALDCVSNRFQTETVIQYAKCGLLGLSTEEISIFENYALVWNITADEWFNEFTANPRGYSDFWSEKDKTNLEIANKVRDTVCEPLKKFKDSTFRPSAAEISENLYYLLIEARADQNLKILYSKLKSQGNFEEAKKEAKIWDILIEILSSIFRIMGNQKISLKKYRDILMSALNSVDCSNIPASHDNVLAGDVSKTRLSGVKVAFVVGVAEGEFPAVNNTPIIFTENEIAQIENMGLEICDNPQFLLLKERFLAYVSLCGASEKLCLSWCMSGGEDGTKMPSEIIKEILEIFPKIKIMSRQNYGAKDLIWSKQSAFEICAQYYNNKTPISNTLQKYFEKDDEYKSKYELLKDLELKNTIKFTDSKNATKIFDGNIKLSASQIEKYHKCPFEYFCEYGLGAKEIKTAKFGSLEYGSMIHFVFEKLFKKYSKNEITILDENKLKNVVEKLIENYVNTKLISNTQRSKRFDYIIERCKATTLMLIKHLITEIKQSKFKTKACELEITEHSSVKPLKIKLPGGDFAIVEGKIDRVDCFKTGEENYIRVIDYKTGQKSFRLSDILSGLNMQMLIYLMTVTKNGQRKFGESIPAGVLYFKAIKPSTEISGKSDEGSLQEDLFNQLKMDGLILNSNEVIDAMEKSSEKDFLPKENKNGKIQKSDKTVNKEDFEIIFKYIETKISDMAENLKRGEVPPKPMLYSNIEECRNCCYMPVCRYEKNEFAKPPSKISQEKIIEQLKNFTETGE